MSKIVIDVLFGDLTFPGYLDRLLRLGAEFEKLHPEYAVNIRSTDFRKLPMEISASTLRGEPPAVTEYYSYMTPAARDSRDLDGRPLFASFEKAIGGRREILGEPVVLDDIAPGLRDYYTYQGELISMPIAATTMVLYANTTLLRRAGITEMPRTWHELEAACERVSRLPDGPSHAITWANHGFFFQQALAMQGGTLGDRDDGRSGRATTVDLVSKEMMTWIRWWQHMYDKGYYLYTGKIPDWAGNLKAFTDQQVVFRLASSNDVNYMVQAAAKGGFDMQVSRYPHLDGVPYQGHVVAGTSLWLRSGLDEATQDGALAFMQFLNNPANAADQHRANSFMPVTNAAFELLRGEGWFDRYPHHRVASEQIRSYPPTSPAAGTPPARGAMIGDYAGIQDVLTLAMADVLLRGDDPVARFTQATADAQRLLDAYHDDCADGGPRRPTSLRMEYFRDAKEYTAADLDEVVQTDG